MEAAAHGNSTLGIPKSVGEEFVNADKKDSADPARAAGILFATPGGQVLFLKRGSGGDFPGAFCFPGGHAEGDETALQAAERETIEEVGHLPEGERALLCRSIRQFGDDMTTAPVDFITFRQEVAEQFIPEVSGEHTGHCWALATEPPEPLHPGCRTALAMLTANELDIARLMAAGELTSPQRFGGYWLFDIRITGTGAAYRSSADETAWRDPNDYLHDEFLARCNGLPVLLEHTDAGGLNSEEWAKRSVGTVFLPYIKTDEVWGIAKIYDEHTVKLLLKYQMSTSPDVWVATPDNFIHIDGQPKILIEGGPDVIDHIAICWAGVWDKGGEPTGINSNGTGDFDMATPEEEAKAKKDAAEATEAREKADAEFRDAVMGGMKKLDSVCERMDAMEAKLDAKKDEDESEEDKAKKDAEEAEAKEKAEKEDRAKKDAAALSSRMDEIEGKIPAERSDEETAEMADAQEKADSVLSALGQRAPRPLAGEKPDAYERRLAKIMQPHSKDWAAIDLNSLSRDALKIASNAIRKDALAFANSPASGPRGRVTYTKTRTDAGHTILTPRGHIGDFLRPFRADSQAVILKHPSQVAQGR